MHDLGFLPVGTVEGAREAIADPDLWHPRKGFSVVAQRAIVPSIPIVYEHIERHADADTVVAASGIAFGVADAGVRADRVAKELNLTTRHDVHEGSLFGRDIELVDFSTTI